MKQPTQRQIKALRKRYNELIAEAQAKCITDFQEVRKYVFSKLAELKEDDKLYKILQAYIVEQYNQMFLGLKTNIVDNYNTAGIIEVNFASQTLGEKLAYIPAIVKILPKTKPFEITNRILAKKSVLKRSKIMANQVTDAIANSFESGSSIQEVQRKIDIIMGFRNAQGQINEKAKQLIIDGKFSHRNGHIYETYRIARTETMRMASLRTHEIFNTVERNDKRLKLWATLDNRTRPQSAMMHGQISDEKGRFRYPDGKFYELGEAPPQWSINDRETQFVVFLDNPEIAKELQAQEKAEKIYIKQGQNNLLPTLMTVNAEEIGSRNKSVLLKRNIINRNAKRHPDINLTEGQKILSALYQPTTIIQDQNKTNYYHFIRNMGNTNYVVLLDATKNKKQFEIVHYFTMNDKKLEKLINKNK